MKVYIVTIDDIEDHYPDKAFDSREKAQAYFDEKFAEVKSIFPEATLNNFQRMIVELEVK